MQTHCVTYDSILDLVDQAEKNYNAGLTRFDPRTSFHGVSSFEAAFKLARKGWDAKRAPVMEMVGHSLESVEKLIERDAFESVFDMSGGVVDMGRFLNGDPECMVDFLPTIEEGAAQCITIVVSISASGAVDTKTKIAYGELVASLIFALDRLGINTEVYCEWGNSKYGDRYHGSIRTKIKGANDDLDAARMIYAVAHPSMHRVLCWAAAVTHPLASAIGWDRGSYLTPEPPIEDMEEGTTYMPMIEYGMDKTRAVDFITKYFRMLGIVEETA